MFAHTAQLAQELRVVTTECPNDSILLVIFAILAHREFCFVPKVSEVIHELLELLHVEECRSIRILNTAWYVVTCCGIVNDTHTTPETVDEELPY